MQNERRETPSQFLSPTETRFTPEKMNALLDVEPPLNIEQRVIAEAEALKMQLKENFHLTVIGSKNGRSILEATQANPEIKKFIQQEFENYNWEYRLLPEFYKLQKFYNRTALNRSGYGEDVPEHNRYTIIQMAELPGLSNFYQEINRRTDLNLPIPIPHITLYSGADYQPLASRGIGVDSEADFIKYQPKSI